MPASINSQTFADQERQSIQYAKQSLAHGEPDSKITAQIIQSYYPNDPAQGYDYARYILAEARFALNQEALIHKEQSNMSQGNNNRNDTENRNNNNEQYKRDWAYAVRSLEKGDTPEKVNKEMAAFHKDLPDPQKYAETTVAKVQQHLQVRDELAKATSEEPAQLANYAALDKALQQTSHFEVARHLYQDGANRETVTEFLKRDHRLGDKRADSIAKEAETRFFAERDLNYAVRARERGEGDDRIIPKIAEYRQGQVDNPHDYARAVLTAADAVREAERHQPDHALADQQISAAQQQYRRDLQFAVFQLENRNPHQVRLDISERRPEKAYQSLSFHIHGDPAHSYATAITEQAEKIRQVTERGRSLEETLDVAERDFGRHLQQASNQREAGQSSDQIIKNFTERTGTTEHYARAILNQAHTIQEHARQMSIRPEMARDALEHTKVAQERVPARSATAVER
ncbi:MAG TPA: hypothetical protein VI685_20935 [Candidatus Angelobacter sp.]